MPAQALLEHGYETVQEGVHCFGVGALRARFWGHVYDISA